MEIHGRIARIVGRGRRPFILAAEALETGPGFQQRAIDREVFVREQARRARLGEDAIKERGGDVTLQQPISILAESCRRPDRVIHAEADKPPVQHAVVDLLHQEPLAAHRVERLNQQGPQQLLRGNRRPADVGVHLRESRRQRGEYLVGHAPNRAQGMVRAYPLLRRQVTEHAAGLVVGSTHPAAPFRVVGSIVVRRDHDVDPLEVTFSAPC
jgi:hypothetical protein